MVDTKAKCDTLYFARLDQQRGNQEIVNGTLVGVTTKGSTTKQTTQLGTPPEHIAIFTNIVQEWAYVGRRCGSESLATYKRRIYTIQRDKQRAANPPVEIRVQRKFPQVRWTIVWKNINMTFLPCKVRTTWYIHVLCSLSFVGMIS